MVRAFAFCAVILAACTASAQTVTPRIISQPEPSEKLGIAIPEPMPVSACNEQDCPDSTSITAVDAPFDKHALLKQKLAEMNCLQSEIDALRLATGTPEQISVKVRMLEVSKTKMKRLGTDYSSLTGKTHAAPAAPNSPPSDMGGAVGFKEVEDAKALNGFIDQLLQNNVAKVLAEPLLVTTCGRPTQFNVGGEIPVPSAPGAKQAAEFKPFGTQVDVLATALGENRVRLDLRARLSEIDSGKTIEVNGAQVPGLTVREVRSPLNLELGKGGIVLSGLVERRVETIKYSNGKTADIVNEIELVMVVTAEAADALDVHAETGTGRAYRTAAVEPEVDPKERSRVVRDAPK
jgi:hypothetical protein